MIASSCSVRQALLLGDQSEEMGLKPSYLLIIDKRLLWHDLLVV